MADCRTSVATRAGPCGPSCPARPTPSGPPGPDRRDPVAVLEEQGATREPELLPIRYGRMAESPFAFFRGAAAVMAMDLATTPVTGLRVQACGDAHVTNFGQFATPERNMIFDINDFDETLPGPWEWDVKRLCASLARGGPRPRLLGSQVRPGGDHRGPHLPRVPGRLGRAAGPGHLVRPHPHRPGHLALPPPVPAAGEA